MRRRLRELLKTHVKERIGVWKYPRWIEFVDSLPKTATGKIQRFRLREGMLMRQDGTARPSPAPSSRGGGVSGVRAGRDAGRNRLVGAGAGCGADAGAAARGAGLRRAVARFSGRAGRRHRLRRVRLFAVRLWRSDPATRCPGR